MFTEPGANNCLSIIFRGEYQGLQNNGLKHKNTDAMFMFIHVCSRSFNNNLTCTLIVNQFTHRVRQ